MRKIVISNCYGGFGLSQATIEAYAVRKGLTLYPEKGEYSDLMGMTNYLVPAEQRTPEIECWAAASLEERQAYNAAIEKERLYDRDIPRDDVDLVAVVEQLGTVKASTRFSNLIIVEIPDDVEWEIKEYDGLEWIAEKHRTWS